MDKLRGLLFRVLIFLFTRQIFIICPTVVLLASPVATLRSSSCSLFSILEKFYYIKFSKKQWLCAVPFLQERPGEALCNNNY